METVDVCILCSERHSHHARISDIRALMRAEGIKCSRLRWVDLFDVARMLAKSRVALVMLFPRDETDVRLTERVKMAIESGKAIVLFAEQAPPQTARNEGIYRILSDRLWVESRDNQAEMNWAILEAVAAALGRHISGPPPTPTKPGEQNMARRIVKAESPDMAESSLCRDMASADEESLDPRERRERERELRVWEQEREQELEREGKEERQRELSRPGVMGEPLEYVDGSPLPPSRPCGRRTPRGRFGLFGAWGREKVNCSLFAPHKARPGDAVLVQIFAHLAREAGRARVAAGECDPDTSRRRHLSLGARVQRGDRLQFELTIPPLAVESPVREIVWEGRCNAVQFAVGVPKTTRKGSVVGRVAVLQNSAPIGEVLFTMSIGRAGEAWKLCERGSAQTGIARRHRQAFISYSREDKSEVLRRVPMLTAVGVTYFQDILDLEPGDRWLPQIYQAIDRSDVFLLFWSSHARQSQWVRKEWKHALKRKDEGFIRPVIIEGPPTPAPPPELAHLYFDDPTRYYWRAV